MASATITCILSFSTAGNWSLHAAVHILQFLVPVDPVACMDQASRWQLSGCFDTGSITPAEKFLKRWKGQKCCVTTGLLSHSLWAAEVCMYNTHSLSGRMIGGVSHWHTPLWHPTTLSGWSLTPAQPSQASCLHWKLYSVKSTLLLGVNLANLHCANRASATTKNKNKLVVACEKEQA